MRGARAPDRRGERVGELLGLELERARQARGGARQRRVEDHGGELRWIYARVFERGDHHFLEHGREHLGAEALLPLARERVVGQAPHVEQLGGRRRATAQDRDRLGVGAAGEAHRGVAAGALARSAGCADHDVGGGDERPAACGGEVEADEQRGEPRARRRADLERRGRLRQRQRGVHRGCIRFLGVGRARGGEDQRVERAAGVDRVAAGLDRHRHRILVVARGCALAATCAERGAREAEVGDIASVTGDTGHAHTPGVGGRGPERRILLRAASAAKGGVERSRRSAAGDRAEQVQLVAVAQLAREVLGNRSALSVPHQRVAQMRARLDRLR